MLAKKIIDNKEISLESHSIDVYKKVENILETENFLLDKEDKNAVILASLLHDIGKCTKGFQDFLKGKKEKPNQKYWHNEISWAVLSMYFPEISEQTLFYVYWHHGVTNNNSKNQKYNIDILETLESEDLESIIEFTKNIYKKVYKKDIYFEEQIDIKPLPTFLTKNNRQKDSKLLVGLSVLLGADREVEQNKYKTFDFTFEKYKGGRFERQKEIVDKTTKNTIINAKAGFGKTVLGLLWSKKTDKQLIWVCPRIDVAYACYNSIKKEIEDFKSDTSIELVISSEVKESTDKSKNYFESDIVVINIDSFLNSQVNNTTLASLYRLYTSDVVFDEYHEFVTDDPLFASVLRIILGRVQYTNCRNLFLSATYTPINLFWELEQENNTTILPSQFSSYESVHQKPYNIEIKEFKNAKKENDFLNQYLNLDKTLLLFNSISSSQSFYDKDKCPLNIHSNFEQVDKKEKINNLFSMYGKNPERNPENVTSAATIKASLDISFSRASISFFSLESLLQSVGRINRWGEQQQSDITVFLSNKKSEKLAIKNIYDENLNIKEYEKLKTSLKGKEKLNLDELYKIRESFLEENYNLVKRFINQKIRNSEINIENIYPFKIKRDFKDKNKKFKANSNKLRASGYEVFVSVLKENKSLSDPFTKRIYGNFNSTFKDVDLNCRELYKTMQNLKDDRFDYTEVLKSNMNIGNVIQEQSKYNTSPLILLEGYGYNKNIGFHKLKKSK